MRTVGHIFPSVTISFIMIFAASHTVHASTCEEAFARALETASAACLPLGENEICYGHPTVTADIDSADPFDAPGDRIPFDRVSALSTAPYAASTEEWGVAWVQYADASGSTVRLMLFGGVTLANTAEGLALTVLGEGDCTGIHGGIAAASSDADQPVTITVNGEAVEVGDAVFISATDGEVLSVSFDALEALAADTEAAEEEPLPADAVGALLAAEASVSFAVQTFESTSDTLIVPRAGLWALVSHQIRVVNICPGILGDGSRQPVSPPQTVEFDFSEGISVETFLEQRMGSVPPAEFDNPAPNIYTAIGDAAGRPVEVTLTVVSETEFIYSVVAYQIDCLLQTINWWEFQGEE